METLERLLTLIHSIQIFSFLECCIYHKRRRFDESDSDDSDSEKHHDHEHNDGNHQHHKDCPNHIPELEPNHSEQKSEQ